MIKSKSFDITTVSAIRRLQKRKQFTVTGKDVKELIETWNKDEEPKRRTWKDLPNRIVR